MPELPEVHTTVTGLHRVLPGLSIKDIWTDYRSTFHAGKDNIKNPLFFKKFRATCVGEKITSVTRRGKNVLIHLSNGYTILVHMKMTGHLLYGEYKKEKNSKNKKGKWVATKPGPLRDDPFNGWIHFVISLSNKKRLVLSDMRKFAKITFIKTTTLPHSPDLNHLGPEPTDHAFTFAIFKEQLNKRPHGRIKSVLMDQSLISGIGNIYSDELLWKAGVHPESHPEKIPDPVLKKMYHAMKEVLAKGIDFGGDSMSDYRNVDGAPGKFQHTHNAYRRTKERCKKPGCRGIIARKIIGGRSGHFCTVHQKLLQ